MVSLHRMKIDALVQSWLVTMRMLSNPPDVGSLTMKSRAIVWKGSAFATGVMGESRGFEGWVFTLDIWQAVQPWM